MAEYEFVLKFSLLKDERDQDAIVERLGEFGCTDATLGIGVTGIVALDFSREAPRAEEAVCSAIADIQAALPSATLLEAGPDLVGLSDVADRMGVARQSIRKLWASHEDFPAPIHSGTTALWHLADVLNWLKDRNGYEPAPAAIETAEMTAVVNIARDRRRHPAGERVDSLVF